MYTDHLGNVGALSDKNGSYTSGSLTLFRPFGEYRRTPSTNPDITDRAFTGHKHNDDLGLIYMNARYYLGSIGRFVSADPIIPNIMNPQSLNKYSYVNNSPINFSDPSGQCIPSECPWVTDIVIEVTDLYPYEDLGKLPDLGTYEEEIKWLLFIEREEASTGMAAYVEGGIMVSGEVEDGLMRNVTGNIMRGNDFITVKALTEQYNVPDLYEVAAYQYYGNVGAGAKGIISVTGDNSDLIGGSLPKNPISEANQPALGRLFDWWDKSGIKKTFGELRKVQINIAKSISDKLQDWLGMEE